MRAACALGTPCACWNFSNCAEFGAPPAQSPLLPTLLSQAADLHLSFFVVRMCNMRLTLLTNARVHKTVLLTKGQCWQISRTYAPWNFAPAEQPLHILKYPSGDKENVAFTNHGVLFSLETEVLPHARTGVDVEGTCTPAA